MDDCDGAIWLTKWLLLLFMSMPLGALVAYTVNKLVITLSKDQFFYVSVSFPALVGISGSINGFIATF